MLGSDYRELIVPRADQQKKCTAILIGGIILIAALILLFMILRSIIMFLVIAAAGFGTWYLFNQNRIEYEYVIFGDEVRITKIIAQNKRKEMLTASLRRFTAFGSLADAPQLTDAQTLVLACAAQDSSAYYADFEHEEYGQTRLVMTPDDSILDYIAKHLPRNVQFDYTPETETEE